MCFRATAYAGKTKEGIHRGGFFKTGDVGKIDERGYSHIVGRSKDLIISAATTSTRQRSRAISTICRVSPKAPCRCTATRFWRGRRGDVIANLEAPVTAMPSLPGSSQAGELQDSQTLLCRPNCRATPWGRFKRFAARAAQGAFCRLTGSSARRRPPRSCARAMWPVPRRPAPVQKPPVARCPCVHPEQTHQPAQR